MEISTFIEYNNLMSLLDKFLEVEVQVKEGAWFSF